MTHYSEKNQRINVEVSRESDTCDWWTFTLYSSSPRRILGGGIVRGKAADARRAGESAVRNLEMQKEAA